jgi:hypothetical protein
MPQFFSRAEASEGPSKEAGQPDPDGEVEPDDDVRTVEEQCSELGAVDRVDDPFVRRDDRLDDCTKLVCR